LKILGQRLHPLTCRRGVIQKENTKRNKKKSRHLNFGEDISLATTPSMQKDIGRIGSSAIKKEGGRWSEGKVIIKRDIPLGVMK